MDFFMLFDTLVISFARYKEYIIWQISFIKFSDVLLAFTCAITSDLNSFWFSSAFAMFI